MVLKSIELTGFKSFAKKTELVFNVPVTAIVGPNGSGKSNVVEAIRFVLGEQSIKSLRGKGGSDMIFKGSKSLSALSRARVAITFDNANKIFQFQRTSDQKVQVDFDEVVLSREVFSDGSNEYMINGTVVRLKDIVEILSSVNIGSSGHHIISQGEADRLLSANAKDRRGMIEDALGLRVYQFRLREAEKKLEKTVQNMKEVSSLRREIGPHIVFLKKQVEKIEKARSLREEVITLYHRYFFEESRLLANMVSSISDERVRIQEEKKHIQENISLKEKELLSLDQIYKPEWLATIDTKEQNVRLLREEITRKLGRTEGAIEMTTQSLIRLQKKPESKESYIPLSRLTLFREELHTLYTAINTASSVDEQISLITKVRDLIGVFLQSENSASVEPQLQDTSEIEQELQELRAIHKNLEKELENIQLQVNEVHTERTAYTTERDMSRKSLRDLEHAVYEEKRAYDALVAKEERLSYQEGELARRRAKIEEEKQEAEVLVGADAILLPSDLTHDENWNEALHEDLRKRIERIKIKIEDIGGGGGGDVLKEYEEKVARDQFLSKELIDLENAMTELRGLIRELKETIDREFKVGVEKINKQFHEFFGLMFGGGSAFLSIVVEHKRPSKDEEEEIPVDSDEDFTFERGIEINVSLPHKKVKELSMLSGGERSLTSIALLFAMSQVNPPPFLVLDETDAALDEANSRRYGDMIENLSQYSQLIVVTHNRETMSRARVLYGVTIGADGGSKLLSIKFDDAVKIAK